MRQFLADPLSLVIEKFRSGSSKGEFTLVVGPKIIRSVMINYEIGDS